MPSDAALPPHDPRKALYDWDEASVMVGLTPASIATYCKRGTYGMQRGRDWLVVRYRHGVYPRNVAKVTQAGILRLLQRGMNTHG